MFREYLDIVPGQLVRIPVSRKRLYLVNQHGRKLLQLVVKDEQTRVAAVRHAQLKIIPYGTRVARVSSSSGCVDGGEGGRLFD